MMIDIRGKTIFKLSKIFISSILIFVFLLSPVIPVAGPNIVNAVGGNPGTPTGATPQSGITGATAAGDPTPGSSTGQGTATIDAGGFIGATAGAGVGVSIGANPRNQNTVSDVNSGACFAPVYIGPIPLPYWDLLNCMNILLYGILSATSVLVTVAGVVMDFSFEFFVTDMASHLGLGSPSGGSNTANVTTSQANTGSNHPVIQGWRTFRDLANIVFLFILLYAAINIIIGGSTDTKRIISRTIIVAILVNFSFFLTGLVIDIGNIVALVFYNAFSSGSQGKLGQVFLNLFQPGRFFGDLSIQANFEQGPQHKYAASIRSAGVAGSFAVFGLGIVLFILAGAAFMFAAIQLIVRFIAFMFLLMLSPFLIVIFGIIVGALLTYFINLYLNKRIRKEP